MARQNQIFRNLNLCLDDFLSFDGFLRTQKKIVHQIWFGTIPNKTSAKKAYLQMELYRKTWEKNLEDYIVVEWNKKMCQYLVRNFYKEYEDMFKSYKYEIQRCDIVRYMILDRYGGWYADMDYVCNRPLSEVHRDFSHNLYLVESPNGSFLQNPDHISNSLMFSEKNNPFWRQVLLDMEKGKNVPYFYTKHLHVMFTTGPGILNKIYLANKIKYNIKKLPYQLFHPYGINTDVRSLNLDPKIYMAHIGKSTWIGKDSEFLLIIMKDWKFLMFIAIVTLLCIILIKITKKKA